MKLPNPRRLSSINAASASWILVFVVFSPNLTYAADPSSAAAKASAPAASVAPVASPTSAPPAAPPLPTLFFTAKERAALDAARKRGEITITGTATVAATVAPSLDGFVKRSDGKTFVWINGQAKLVKDKQTDRKLAPSFTGEPSTVVIKPTGAASESRK